MIRHAAANLTITVGSLTVAVVEPAFKTLLVFTVGFPTLLALYSLPAELCAIAVASVTTTANIKRFRATAAEALPEDDIRVPAHPHSIALWTNKPSS